MRLWVFLHRWIGLASAAFALVAGVTGGILLFVDSPAVEQIHVRLLAGPTGEWIVNLATVAVLLLVPTGLVLWWRRPRFTISTRRSLYRTVYDVHNVLGFYASILILVLAATGVFLGFEQPLARLFGVEEWRIPDAPHSVARDGAPSLSPAAYLGSARRAVPCGTVTGMTIGKRRTSSVRIEMRGPGAFDRATVFLDRYSGAVLRIDDLASAPAWYRMRVVALALHTGNVYGIAGKALALLAAIALTTLVITGAWMWIVR